MRLSAAAMLLAAGSPVLAQVGGEATWLWDVTTEDGDAIVEPGETATVTLSVDMTPDVNFPDGPVLGFGGAVFDTLGGIGAANGQILDWEVLSALDELTGDFTTLDGVDMVGTQAAQSLNIDGPFSDADPIDVFQFTWATDDFSGYVVEYTTETFVGDPPQAHTIIVWEGEFLGEFDVFYWPITEAAISFEVVPAPGTLVLLAGATGFWVRRRP
jgi:hypothetical protein